MTFVQPRKNSGVLAGALVFLCIALTASVVYLIVVYNHVVNLEHNLSRLESHYRLLETENAEIKEQIFTLFTTQNLEAFAAERQLIQEKNPRYFTDQQWLFASRSL